MQFFAFSTNNLVMPPSLLLPSASPVLVVSAEAHCAEQLHFVILKITIQKKIFHSGEETSLCHAMLGESEMLLH